MEVLEKIKGLFTKKKPVEEVIETETIKPTYEELIALNTALQREYLRVEDTCAREGYSYDDMQFKAQDIIKKIVDTDREIRLIQEPSIDYGVSDDINEKRITFNEFVRRCRLNIITDEDGFGKYASKKGVSDIVVYPSDIASGKFRTDFSHIIWFNNGKKEI